MFRRASSFYCYTVPLLSRVGVFPLHLDPPTAQHREIFRLLLGDTKRDFTTDGRCDNNVDGSVPHRLDENGYFAGSLCCLESFAESLKQSKYVPFDHLILVPNTRFPAALRLSTHIAALTVLITRGLSRVHVDFTALEHPDEDMTCVYELTQKYKNSTLVHWLQDAHEMHTWAHFADVKSRVPMLLLQTISLPVAMAVKPQDTRLNEGALLGGCSSLSVGQKIREQQQLTEKAKCNASSEQSSFTTMSKGNIKSSNGNSDSNHKGSAFWVAEGCGEEEVDISRSYISSSSVSWLAFSDDVSTLMQPSESDNMKTHSGSKNNENNNNNNNSTNDILGCKGCIDHSITLDTSLTASGGSGYNNDSNDMSKNVVLPLNSTLENDDLASAAKESRKKTEEEEEDIDNHSLLYDSMPVRRKVSHLIEELFFTHQAMEGDEEHLSGEFAQPRVEVHSVLRCTGADVRQALWERELDPSLLLTEPVYRYISSHGLYQDYRKDAYMNFSRVQHYYGVACDGENNTNSSRRKGKMPYLGFSASLVFPGYIPRLELHYDKNNSLARDYYEKLSVFEVSKHEDPDLIVPIGGDGYMMHCIRNNWMRFIPFFGVNAGHVGYLLNDPSTLEELLSAPLKLYTTTMLYCLAEKETESGEKEQLSELAFNDAWVERSSGQTALIRILVNGEERISQLRGDGVLVATAAGSTAYCQALGASPVPVGAPLIQVVGSNVVSPAQWRPTHLNQEDQVELEVIDSHKRPCRCFVDSVDVGNVTRMLVRSSRAAGVVIAFASSCDLQQKLYQMQFPKSI